MRLIKYTHASVRLEHDGGALLIDPGTECEPEAYNEVTSILITHEHDDHVDVARLPSVVAGNPDLRIYTGSGTAARLSALGDAVVTVKVGETFTVDGLTVEAVGGDHAEIFEGLPGCENLGYIVDGDVYHPGDALHVPAAPVSTLLLPTSGPWFKLGDALHFVRAVAPRRAYSIHDASLSPRGMDNVDKWVQMKGQTDYGRIPVGTAVDV